MWHTLYGESEKAPKGGYLTCLTATHAPDDTESRLVLRNGRVTGLAVAQFWIATNICARRYGRRSLNY